MKLNVDQTAKPMSPLAFRAIEVADRTDGLADFLAAVPFPAGLVLVDGGGSTDWVILDARLDPHLTSGTLSIPREARRRLQRIDASGVAFDALLIGHELPPNTVRALSDTQRAALIAQADGIWKDAVPAELHQDLGDLIGAPTPERAATKVVALTEKVLRSLAQCAKGAVSAAVGAVAFSSELALDPVVFGVAAARDDPRPGELVALFYLAHWT